MDSGQTAYVSSSITPDIANSLNHSANPTVEAYVQSILANENVKNTEWWCPILGCNCNEAFQGPARKTPFTSKQNRNRHISAKYLINIPTTQREKKVGGKEWWCTIPGCQYNDAYKGPKVKRSFTLKDSRDRHVLTQHGINIYPVTRFKKRRRVKAWWCIVAGCQHHKDYKGRGVKKPFSQKCNRNRDVKTIHKINISPETGRASGSDTESSEEASDTEDENPTEQTVQLSPRREAEQHLSFDPIAQPSLPILPYPIESGESVLPEAVQLSPWQEVEQHLSFNPTEQTLLPILPYHVESGESSIQEAVLLSPWQNAEQHLSLNQ